MRICAAAGASAATFCAAALVALDLLPPTNRLNPLSQPLSEYARGSDGAIFDAAVIVLAVGVSALLAALLMDRRVRWAGATALAACAASLVVLVAFPDITTAGRLTPVGWTHWTASMVAFGVMPIVPLRLWRQHRGLRGCAALPRIIGGIGLLCFAWFALLMGGNIVAFATRIPLWRVGGLIERLLAGTELLAAVVMSAWIWAGCRCRRCTDNRARPPLPRGVAREFTDRCRTVGAACARPSMWAGVLMDFGYVARVYGPAVPWRDRLAHERNG